MTASPFEKKKRCTDSRKMAVILKNGCHLEFLRDEHCFPKKHSEETIFTKCYAYITV